MDKLKFLLIYGMAIFFLGSCSFRKKSFSTTAESPPSHEQWSNLLAKHVRDNGDVDYKGFIKDSIDLNKYLDLLSNNAPDPNKWTDEERLAYWINAYNAFTIQIVIRHYPIDGIKEIASGLSIPFVSTTWDIKFIELGGERINLNRIEHGIIRNEFEEPRIHFAVNCASVSCPILRNEAYNADNLEEQLEDQVKTFINDPSRNKFISEEKAEVSKLFTWFAGDFKKKDKSIIDFINRYSYQKLKPEAELSYLEYNWGLNDVKSIDQE